MKKIFTLIIVVLFVQYTFAQDLLNELNSSLKTNIKICIEGQWFDVNHFKINKIDGQHFEANVKLVDSKSNHKEYIISNYTPYYIKEGNWCNINGEYQQKGDIRKIHIYNNYKYGAKNFEFKSYRPDGVLGEHKILNGFYLLFHEQINAQNFVSITHKLQGDAYNSTPWLKTFNESIHYNSQTSKQIFESILKDFKQYEVKSEQVHKNADWTETTNLKIKYKYPNIIISHTDVTTTNFNFGNGFKQGTLTIKIPINDSQFELEQGNFGEDNESILCIYSPSGIEISHNGKKNIIESYKFYASKIVCKNLIQKFLTFKKKVLEENYRGEYGFQRLTQKSKSKNKSQKLSGGKYVQ